MQPAALGGALRADQGDDDAFGVGLELAGVGVEEDHLANRKAQVIGKPALGDVRALGLIPKRDLDFLQRLVLWRSTDSVTS